MIASVERFPTFVRLLVWIDGQLCRAFPRLRRH